MLVGILALLPLLGAWMAMSDGHAMAMDTMIKQQPILDEVMSQVDVVSATADLAADHAQCDQIKSGIDCSSGHCCAAMMKVLDQVADLGRGPLSTGLPMPVTAVFLAQEIKPPRFN